MQRQTRLFDRAGEDRGLKSLLVSDGLRGVIGPLTDPSAAWPQGGMLLIGPPASGKSHFGFAFLQAAGSGRRLSALAPLTAEVALWRQTGGALLLDDADQVGDEAGLFLLLEAAWAGAGRLLLTATDPPRQWRLQMGDLRSRLEAMARLVTPDPDESLLAALLTRLCRQRFIKLDETAAMYLARHMERTYAEAVRVTEVLDALVVRGSRAIGAPTAARALRLINPGAPGLEPLLDTPFRPKDRIDGHQSP
jgi:chromosomal replication initiation ATPase DnaA